MNTRSSRIPLFILAVSSLFALAAAEIATRWLLPRTVPLPGTVFLSSPHFRLDDRGAVRHLPNEDVRLVMFYGDQVEFDVRFETNDRGLVDHRDYPVSDESQLHYAFVGNSFVHGMGADPWVPELRDRLRDRAVPLEIYNLGVNGASIHHFRKLLASMAGELPVTHVVLIAISNDFFRPWWSPVPTDVGVDFCVTPSQCRRGLFPRIDYDASLDDLLKRVQALRDEEAREAPIDPLWKRALWQSEFYLLVRRGVRDLVQRVHPPSADGSDFENRQHLDGNLEALAGIREDFPRLPITLAHFPQKEELQAGRYDLDLEPHAAAAGMSYFPALTDCSWSVDMYHRNDGHPNARGYRNFADCLSNRLFPGSRY